MWKWAPYYTRISIFPCFFFLSSSLPHQNTTALFSHLTSPNLFSSILCLFLFYSLLFILTPLLSPWLHLPSPTLRLFMLVPSGEIINYRYVTVKFVVKAVLDTLR